MKQLPRIALAIGILAPTGLHADAVVSAIKGGVLVSRGTGFERTTAPTNLKTGDRVTVTEGNSARVVYQDYCSVDVRPGAIHIVGAVSPCVAAQAAASAQGCKIAREGDDGKLSNCPAASSKSPDLSGAARVVGVVGQVVISPLPEGQEGGSAETKP